jgi:hypothetical protein
VRLITNIPAQQAPPLRTYYSVMTGVRMQLDERPTIPDNTHLRFKSTHRPVNMKDVHNAPEQQVSEGSQQNSFLQPFSEFRQHPSNDMVRQSEILRETNTDPRRSIFRQQGNLITISHRQASPGRAYWTRTSVIAAVSVTYRARLANGEQSANDTRSVRPHRALNVWYGRRRWYRSTAVEGMI